MMLNSLFAIDNIQLSETKDYLKARITLNKSHSIFEGHFPTQPVLPGVCTVEILKETLSLALNMNFKLIQADTIKFQHPIVPTETPVLEVNLTLSYNEHISVNARFEIKDKVFCSFKGQFLKISD